MKMLLRTYPLSLVKSIKTNRHHIHCRKRIFHFPSCPGRITQDSLDFCLVPNYLLSFPKLFNKRIHYIVKNNTIQSRLNNVFLRNYGYVHRTLHHLLKIDQRDVVIINSKRNYTMRYCDPLLDDVRAQLGLPDWLHLLNSCFNRICSYGCPTDMTTLRLSLVQQYSQDEDMETEYLIVLLLASLSEKMAFFRHHCPQRISTAEYDSFRAVTDKGHVTLANCLTISRILILLHHHATEDLAVTNANIYPDDKQCIYDESGSVDGENETMSKIRPCGKLDKSRILFADLCIAVILKEAASTGNNLIPHYSFKAFQNIIFGMFRVDGRKRTINKQELGEKGRCPLNLSNTKPDRTQYIASCDEKGDSNDELLNDLLPSIYRKEIPNYSCSSSDELGVICKGVMAVSGHEEDVQAAAFNFGRTLSLAIQIRQHGGIESNHVDLLLNRLLSNLQVFPECANKRLLMSLCRVSLLEY